MSLLALVPLLIWTYLLLGRGFFWLTRERDDVGDHAPDILQSWPSVVAIVPARDEADVIAHSLEGLLAQDYPGKFRVVLVDDQSNDGTAEEATRVARRHSAGERLELHCGKARPAGWTGKLWALHQGVGLVSEEDAPEYLLFTDADIAHAPDNLRRLVGRAKDGRFVLVSLMAKLHCDSIAEKLLIPAFVLFFAMLFPFAWVNDPARTTAAAAGGCMLVRRDALVAAGGLKSIASAIIDDCALARILKHEGQIWLGLTNRATSIRPYSGFGEIGGMVARSAYAQLNYSPALLCGAVLGMLIVYVAPLLFALFAHGPARIEAVVAWLLMAVAYQPILRFYRLTPIWGAALPVIGAIYTGFTVDSAIQHWRGRGGMWKGRAQAPA